MTDYSYAQISIPGISEDTLTLLTAKADEALSELPTIVAKVLCGDDDMLAKKLGSMVSIQVIGLTDATLREFNGVLTEIEFLEKRDGKSHYRLVLRPKLHLYAHNREYRIFQDMSSLDIVHTVFKDRNIEASYQTSGTYAVRPYSVQYGESDFAFASRIMEEDGLYYYVTHKDGQNTIVVCDGAMGHKPGPVPVLTFNTWMGDHPVNADEGHAYATTWHETLRNLGQRKVTLRDFNFETPNADLTVQSATVSYNTGHDLDVYDYASSYGDAGNGTSKSKVRMQAIETGRQVYSCHARSTALQVGDFFDLHDSPLSRPTEQSFLITRLSTIMTGKTVDSGNNSGLESGCDVECIQKQVRWAPRARTRRPLARGPETAIVTGPDKEEIHTDKYGRVKVQFHWDRAGKRDENTSCWVRVSQTGGLGNVILPRVGHEVVVDFIDGNPDRPLVVGRVFNPNHMPVYALPDHKTRAVWRTKTYGKADAALDDGAEELDTGNPASNEIRFEDESGAEEMFFHSQRNMAVRVRNDSGTLIGHDQMTRVGRDDSRSIGRDSLLSIEGDSTREVKGNEKHTTKGAKTVTIDGDETVTIGGKREETLKGEHKTKTTGKTTLETQDAIETTLKMGDYTLKTAMGDMSVKADMGNIAVKAALGTIAIEAMQGITLTCGPSKITMDMSGIKLEGIMIEVNGTAMTKVTAGAMVQVQGGIIMLN